ncbi:hypothetical protein IFM89_034985 [Coptis chinensis]|uniref:Uncharacterized protein n=1 Tax=Coptis chinensis TaxID=261450 RepID=A0A835M860_9MAGN|nr:hypothetical protein IFM89_034985 [Coptis chinensis]
MAYRRESHFNNLSVVSGASEEQKSMNGISNNRKESVNSDGYIVILKLVFQPRSLMVGARIQFFDDNVRLNVPTVDCSLKCEVWMLSRVKNYLEDQLLGFALVPLSDLFVENGKLAQEFSLSTNDLFILLRGLSNCRFPTMELNQRSWLFLLLVVFECKRCYAGF